jgi:hypothetical protein
MTTEKDVVVEAVAEPVIDPLAAEQAKQAAEMDAMLADLKKRREEEAIIAAEQDAALQAVRDACDAERAALAKLVTN